MIEGFLESKDTLVDASQLRILLIDAIDALKKKDSGRI